MPDQPIPPRVAEAMLSAFSVVSIESVTPGMSGGRVFRCVSQDGQQFALKCWPPNTKPPRVAEVHRLQSLARQQGCPIVPALHAADDSGAQETYLQVAGKIWELADWMPGTPLGADASLDLIKAGAAAIGQFHSAIVPPRQQPSAPPAVGNRLRRLSQLQTLIPAALETATDPKYSLTLRETLDDCCVLLLAGWSLVQSQIERALQAQQAARFPIQHVLRDVHREHILFSGREASGLIDFDAIRVDTPATDLARWGSSFLRDRAKPDQVWQAVLAGYGETSPFQQTGDDRFLSLVRDLNLSSTWISLANWAVWLRLECRTFPAGDRAVADRIGELCDLARQGM